MLKKPSDDPLDNLPELRQERDGPNFTIELGDWVDNSVFPGIWVPSQRDRAKNEVFDEVVANWVLSGEFKDAGRNLVGARCGDD